MAAPNIVSATSVYGKTVAGALTTSTVSLLSNASGSGLTLKINSIIIANIDGASAASATVSYNTAAAGGGTDYKIVHTVTVAADATLIALGKDSPIYLEENSSITGLASANGDLHYIISYEEYSA